MNIFIRSTPDVLPIYSRCSRHEEIMRRRSRAGGFGDRAYIGWIPEGEWSGVSDDEVAKARLVGEDGYEKEHSGILEQEVPEL